MRGADQCPECGSEDRILYHFDERFTRHAVCRECGTVWEPFRKRDLWDQGANGNPMEMFAEPCNNCAFRPGSPEREDPARWEELMQEIHLQGYPFYCHKGVPLNPDGTHRHPKKPNGSYDQEKMRPCAGWLAQRLGRAKLELNAAKA